MRARAAHHRQRAIRKQAEGDGSPGPERHGLVAERIVEGHEVHGECAVAGAEEGGSAAKRGNAGDRQRFEILGPTGLAAVSAFRSKRRSWPSGIRVTGISAA